MVLTVTLAIMTTDKTVDSSHRIGYFWMLIAINLAFFIFWIAFYLKILMGSLLEVKFFKNLLSKKRKETLLSRFIKYVSACVLDKNKQENQPVFTDSNPKTKTIKFNIPKHIDFG